MQGIPTIPSYSNVSLKSDGNPEIELVGDEMLKCVRWTLIRLWVSIFLTGCIACNMELVGMEMILHPGGRSHPDNIVLILIWKQYRTHQTCVNQSNEYTTLDCYTLDRAFVTREPGIWGKSVLLPFWMTSQSNCTCRRPLFCPLFHDVGLCHKSFPSLVYKI